MPPDTPPAALRIDLDEAALRHNWRSLDRLSGAARAGAAIKANGYGLGARRVARALQAEGCRDFFVAHWCEIEELRDVLPELTTNEGGAAGVKYQNLVGLLIESVKALKAEIDELKGQR